MKSMTFITTPATIPPTTTFWMFMAIRSSREKGCGLRGKECRSPCQRRQEPIAGERDEPAASAARGALLLLTRLQSLDCFVDRGATREIAAAGKRRRREAEKVPQNLIRLIPA